MVKTVDVRVNVPKNWNDVIISDYIKFVDAEQEYSKVLKKTKNRKNQKSKHKIADTRGIEQLIAMNKMIAALTGNDPDTLLTLNYTPNDDEGITSQYNDFMSRLDFAKTPIPDDHICKSVTFRDITLAEEEAEIKRISSLYWWWQRKGAYKNLKSKLNVEFVIEDDEVEAGPFQEFISTELIKQKREKLQQELKDGKVRVLPELLAHVLRPKGTRYNIEGIERRTGLFASLPLESAVGLGNFFLVCQKLSAMKTLTSSGQDQLALILKHSLNKTMLKLGAGS